MRHVLPVDIEFEMKIIWYRHLHGRRARHKKQRCDEGQEHDDQYTSSSSFAAAIVFKMERNPGKRQVMHCGYFLVSCKGQESRYYFLTRLRDVCGPTSVYCNFDYK